MTKRQQIRTVVEGISVVVVIGSLIFVALEVRLNTAAVRSATQNAVFDGARDNALAFMANDHLRALLVAVGAHPAMLGEIEGTADGLLLEAFHQNRFNTLENAYYHYSEGTLGSDIWLGWQGWLEALADQPVVRYYWERLDTYYMDDFRSLVDEAIARNR